MEIIARAHNNGFVFGQDIKLKEGKQYKIIIEEKKEEVINPKILALVGLIERDEETDDLKEYLSKNKRSDYENIR